MGNNKFNLMLGVFIFLLSFSLVSASLPDDAGTNINFDYPEAPTNSSTLNVNNSQYLQGYTPTSLWTYYVGLGNALWCELTGCVITGDIDTTADINILDGAGLNIIDSGQGEYLKIGRSLIKEYLKITVTDNDLQFLYNQDDDSGSAHNIVFNTIGTQDHDLDTYRWRVDGSSEMVLDRVNGLDLTDNNLTTTGNITANVYSGNRIILAPFFNGVSDWTGLKINDNEDGIHFYADKGYRWYESDSETYNMEYDANNKRLKIANLGDIYGGFINYSDTNLIGTGNITADYYFGDGSQLTGINAGITNLSELTIDENLEMLGFNITNVTKQTFTNSSYGIWSNSTDMIIGYIGGL